MAALLLNPIIYGPKNHGRIASVAVQPKCVKTKSLPKFELEEYMTMKVKQLKKALDMAVPLKHPNILHKAMRHALLAAEKHGVPVLCIASSELVGQDDSLVMPMACAIEMILTATILLDDLPCMDNDDLRRGKPANHKVFGEATTILACHALIYDAIHQVINNTTSKSVSPGRLIRAMEELSSTMGSQGATAGQFEDLNSKGKQVSLSELEFIHRHKTGKLIEASVVCGALVGGGNEDEIERLRRFGKSIGLASQVWNDIMDVTGTTEAMGKKVGGDLLLDKATYPKLIGVDESKKLASRLVAQANEELAFFDPTRAAPLYHIANNISVYT